MMCVIDVVDDVGVMVLVVVQHRAAKLVDSVADGSKERRDGVKRMQAGR